MTESIEVLSGANGVSDAMSDKGYQSVLMKLRDMLSSHVQRMGGSDSFGNFVHFPSQYNNSVNTCLAGQFAILEVDGVEVSNSHTITRVLEIVKHALDTLCNRMAQV